METGTRRKLVFVTALIFALSIVSFIFAPKSPGPQLMHGGDVPALTPLEIRNREIALKYGVVGYLEITSAPGNPKSLILRRGSEISLTILLHFVSHVPEVTETQVKIDPNSGEGLIIEQVYVIEDGKGNIIGRGTANVNKLVSYNPSGLVTIKAGETLPVIMTIRLPKDFPSVSSFPLGAVGITANVPVLDDVRGTVYV